MTCSIVLSSVHYSCGLYYYVMYCHRQHQVMQDLGATLHLNLGTLRHQCFLDFLNPPDHYLLESLRNIQLSLLLLGSSVSVHDGKL